jgi:hypothetical protein
VKVVKASRNSQDDLKSTGQWLFWLHSTDKFLESSSSNTLLLKQCVGCFEFEKLFRF